MKDFPIRIFLLFLLCYAAGCANVVPPTGGKKDVNPPKLVSVTPADSSLNTRFRKLDMRFDEYIAVSDASTQVQTSPLLPVPVTVTVVNKHVYVQLPDTMLQDNTTYRILFGNAIKDVHEGNPFNGYTYTFSTGAYFDSLEVKGKVFNAATGLPDTSAFVMLYDARFSDSVVARQKPAYIGHVTNSGDFSIKGLPAHAFRIFALRDKNANLIFDGNGEWVAFREDIIRPSADSIPDVTLRVFPEGKDTTAGNKSGGNGIRRSLEGPVTAPVNPREGFSYIVALDTADVRRRSTEITKPVSITANKPVKIIAADRIFLSYDSAGVSVEAPVNAVKDTMNSNGLLLQTAWHENTVYTLRLLKGFIKDSAGTDAMPSKYIFRTKREDDYAKLHIHLPAKYQGSGYVLQVTNDRDTIWQKPVTDTMVHLLRIAPGNYTFRIIEDRNGNGIWDSGILFEKKQPEMVIPYSGSVMLKAGWENIVDFEQEEKKSRSGLRGAADNRSPVK